MLLRVVIVVSVAVALIAGGLTLAFLTPAPDYSDEELRAFGFSGFPEPRPIEPFDLADAAGGRFGPDRLLGAWSLLFFGYANCPDICPITMSVLGDAEGLLRDAGDEPFQGILVSVDPERDTPFALARYVAAFSDEFIGVTGEAPKIHAFAKGLLVAFSKVPTEDPELGYLMDHSSHISVIDPLGRHYGFIRPPFDAQRIATLSRALVARQSAGR